MPPKGRPRKKVAAASVDADAGDKRVASEAPLEQPAARRVKSGRDAAAAANARIQDAVAPPPILAPGPASLAAAVVPQDAWARRSRADRLSTPLLYAWLKEYKYEKYGLYDSDSNDRERILSIFANDARIDFPDTEGDAELTAFQECWRRVNRAAVKGGRQPPG